MGTTIGVADRSCAGHLAVRPQTGGVDVPLPAAARFHARSRGETIMLQRARRDRRARDAFGRRTDPAFPAS